MNRIIFFLKKAFTPVTILIIPHDETRSLSVKIPSIGVLILIIMGIFWLAINGLKYPSMAEKVDYYTKQFCEWNLRISALKKVEEDFRRLLSLNSKEKILENMDTSFSGAIDIQTLMQELQKTVETVSEIKDYLRIQKDIYLATPKGLPVAGNISSGYGKRDNPISGEVLFHSGVDISARSGTPIRATADGVVVYYA